MRIVTAILCIVIMLQANAQVSLMPGDKSFDKKIIRNTHFEMAYSSVSGRQTTVISAFEVNILVSTKTVSVYTQISLPGLATVWTDTTIAELPTLKPVYRSSDNSDKHYYINYGNTIKGYYLDKRTGKGNRIKESSTGGFFDSFIYPYLLGALPLTSGYKAVLPVYEYKPGAQRTISFTLITEVKSSMYSSSMTGEHAVWQVSVLEEGTNVKYEYYIDKESRKLWKTEILAANGKRYLLVDKELDYAPFTATFDKDVTLKMVSVGSATISGQVYARDNQNSLKGIAILNVNKKQYAQPGTTVLLIPYTGYFKEWVALNEKLRKKGRSVPLSPAAAECIKVTAVYDNDGNFEFTNLMPGEYYLYTEFGYVHTASRSEVIGYTDNYINGFFQGTSANTQVTKYNTSVTAAVKKTITIKKDGEKVTVKLKKTL